jgi:hypothetical protein
MTDESDAPWWLDSLAESGGLFPHVLEPQKWHESSEQKLAEESYCEGWNACRVAAIEAMQGLDQHLTREQIETAVAAWFETSSAGSFEKRMRAAIGAVFSADAAPNV